MTWVDWLDSQKQKRPFQVFFHIDVRAYFRRLESARFI